MQTKSPGTLGYAAVIGLGVAALGCAAAWASTPGGNWKPLRVCADPNNLPFSNEAQQGFENKLAILVGEALHQPVTYTWHAERRGFIRQTLKAKECDVVMGLPVPYPQAEMTRPYYRSTYVFVSRTDRHLGLASIKDPRLHQLKIGIQIIGEDGFNTPPAHALAAQGIVNNLVAYSVYGDYRNANPPAAIVSAVERGDVDIAAVWGPLAGYFSKQSQVPLTLAPITDTAAFTPLKFEWDIGIGVRKGDEAFRNQLDEIVAQKRPQITSLLQSYGVPLVETTLHQTADTGGSEPKN
jgi:quinoprotein dehydrogenase-associated probable ABC transporter substrate-binding protein